MQEPDIANVDSRRFDLTLPDVGEPRRERPHHEGAGHNVEISSSRAFVRPEGEGGLHPRFAVGMIMTIMKYLPCAVVVAVGLSGCGGSSSTKPDSPPPPPVKIDLTKHLPLNHGLEVGKLEIPAGESVDRKNVRFTCTGKSDCTVNVKKEVGEIIATTFDKGVSVAPYKEILVPKDYEPVVASGTEQTVEIEAGGSEVIQGIRYNCPANTSGCVVSMRNDAGTLTILGLGGPTSPNPMPLFYLAKELDFASGHSWRGVCKGSTGVAGPAEGETGPDCLQRPEAGQELPGTPQNVNVAMNSTSQSSTGHELDRTVGVMGGFTQSFHDPRKTKVPNYNNTRHDPNDDRPDKPKTVDFGWHGSPPLLPVLNRYYNGAPDDYDGDTRDRDKRVSYQITAGNRHLKTIRAERHERFVMEAGWLPNVTGNAARPDNEDVVSFRRTIKNRTTGFEKFDGKYEDDLKGGGKLTAHLWTNIDNSIPAKNVPLGGFDEDENASGDEVLEGSMHPDWALSETHASIISFNSGQNVKSPSVLQPGEQQRFLRNQAVTGQWRGIQGRFRCTEAQCSIRRQYPDNGLTPGGLAVVGDFQFIPNSGERAHANDLDYLALGFWKTTPQNEGRSDGGDYSVGAVADGNDPFDTAKIRGLTGNATYEGKAFGGYTEKKTSVVNDRREGLFSATAKLTAKFGNNSTLNSTLGTISGEISDFDTGDWVVKLEEAEIGVRGDAGAIQGGTSGHASNNHEIQGRWGARFYGNLNERGKGGINHPHPNSVAGTFGATMRDGPDQASGYELNLLGAFGACIEDC